MFEIKKEDAFPAKKQFKSRAKNPRVNSFSYKIQETLKGMTVGDCFFVPDGESVKTIKGSLIGLLVARMKKNLVLPMDFKVIKRRVDVEQGIDANGNEIGEEKGYWFKRTA